MDELGLFLMSINLNIRKKYICIYCLISAMLLLCTACASGAAPEESLRLIVEPSGDQGWTVCTEAKVGESCDYSVAFYNASDVKIVIGGEEYALTDALRQNLVTVESIIAQARLDAKDHTVCREKYHSSFGCTTFIYQYNDFDIVYRNDVFACSDGREYLLKNFIVTPYDQGRTVSLGYSVMENGSLKNLCYEDWGLSFTVSEADFSHVKIACTQSGGQQADQLAVQSYWIEPKDDASGEGISFAPLEKKTEIPADCTSELSFDWSEAYGALPPGEYVLCLSVVEIYDDAAIHSLQKNYTDIQQYGIAFTVS